MLGGAIGDALGYPYEFYGTEAIFRVNEGKPVSKYEIDMDTGFAVISDDTQMTLFTMEGILNYLSGDSKSLTDSLYNSYLNWLLTQKKHYKPGLAGLMSIAELYECRAPGDTCLSALRSGICGTLDNPINNSKGCGGIMRVAPIGFLNPWRFDISMEAAKSAAITHGHPLGYIPAAILAATINNMVYHGEPLVTAVRHALNRAKEKFDCESVAFQKELIDKAIHNSCNGKSDIENIESIGEGWVAEETLAIAIYCSVKYFDNFEKAISAAVSHGGDSDSTGAVTGNLLGAELGLKKIPEKFKRNLEFYSLIIKYSEELYKALNS